MIGSPEPDLADHGNLLVRRAILRDDWVSDRIFDLAAGDQTEWTLEEWATLEMELAQCNLKIKDWLVLYS
jgi:hypothetical protein